MIVRGILLACVALSVCFGMQACGSDDEDQQPTGSGTDAATDTKGSVVDAAADSADASIVTDGSSIDDVGSGDVSLDVDAQIDAACATSVNAYAVVASPHVTACSVVSYGTNPPTSGPHYPIWAAYRTYATPVPRGFYVHDLEHGAVVILYNCPSGCGQELTELQAFLDQRPVDPMCSAGVKARIVVTPDPGIPTKFAAAAWGHALTSNCFDLTALGTFIDAHYAMAAENTCADGIDVTAADAGFPGDCGK